MKISTYIYIFSAFVGLYSCQKETSFKLETSKKLQTSAKLTAQIDMPLESDMSMVYYLDGKKVSTNEVLTLDIKNEKLGKHILKVGVVQGTDTVFKTKKITFLAPKTPEVLKFNVIKAYPHDREAFTQGLEFYKNELYEGTGQRGKSVLRKVELETGTVLKEQKLADKYFGEGITIFNDKVYQLTWQSKIGLIYDVDSFKVTKTFNYQNSKQGWGLTHNDTHLIKSDGTEKIWFLNPETGKEEYFIEVYTNKAKVVDINELEYINGKIYANVWTKNAILIINPKNGAIESVINLSDLPKQLDNKTIQHSTDQVLNGIAYNNETKKLYVTGKNWDKLFEIELVK